MKIVISLLCFIFIFRCSSKDVSTSDEEKSIKIKCTFGSDTLDTFSDTFTRFYFEKEIYKVNFRFSVEEQRKLIDEMDRKNFFDLPESLPYKSFKFEGNEVVGEFVPMIAGSWTDQFIEVELNGKSKKIFWIDYASYKDSEEYIRLKSVMDMILSIVLSRPEIKKLPREAYY